MLGNAIFRVLSENRDWSVFGTIRSNNFKRFFCPLDQECLILIDDVKDIVKVTQSFARIQPDVVINCIGIVKQLSVCSDPLITLPINAMLPHQLNQLCEIFGARLIHLSTDCVFSGRKGNYSESDLPDPEDVYGRSKVLGEVVHGNALTLRTSTIGYELQRSKGLLEWFLGQQSNCRGFTNAVFSGLPSVVLGGVIRDYVIPNDGLSGLYHVAGQPISKYALLQLLAKEFKKKIQVIPDDGITIDRSLNATAFSNVVGYVVAGWPELIGRMMEFEENAKTCLKTRS